MPENYEIINICVYTKKCIIFLLHFFMKYFYLYGIVSALFFSAFFGLETFATDNIPRDGLRLELLFNSGMSDTSGNGRAIAITGITIPTLAVDTAYNVSYMKFVGNGGFKVNTAWNAGVSDDFAMSFWVNIPAGSASGNMIQNLTSPINNFSLSNYLLQPGYSYLVYDTPMVLFSAKTSATDTTNLRFGLTKDGKCSLTSGPRTEYYGYNYFLNGQRLPKTTAIQTDIFSNLESGYQCGNIIDGKWHHVLLSRKNGMLTIYIDGLSIGSSGLYGAIPRILTVGNMGIPMDMNNYINYSPTIRDDIWSKHFFKWGLMGMRLYSRYITPDEVDSLFQEYQYLQSDLQGIGDIQMSIERYLKPNFSVTFRNVPEQLTKENVNYEYAVDGKTFLPLTNMIPLSSASGNLSYRVTMDISTVPDGKVNFTFRIRNTSNAFQNIGTLSFMKADVTVGITIGQPNNELAASKTITATVDGGWQLYMTTTRGTVCDSTITSWDDYTDLVFTNKSDNGVRMCYKAVYPTVNKTIYKLSSAIQGIQPKDQANMSYGVFSDYLLWSKSFYPKSNDTTNMMLELLGVNLQTTSYGPSWLYQWYSVSASNNITLTDINGDGLVDFVYSMANPVRRAIIINNGNYTFKVVYKCAIDVASSVSTYYGDCADLSH